MLWLLATEPGMPLLHKDLSKDLAYLKVNPFLINSIFYAFEIHIEFHISSRLLPKGASEIDNSWAMSHGINFNSMSVWPRL